MSDATGIGDRYDLDSTQLDGAVMYCRTCGFRGEMPLDDHLDYPYRLVDIIALAMRHELAFHYPISDAA